ncbi:EsaB/YukD family protein [Bombilactobacillus thymidiniphilus]|uniref:Uncharacterized protein n=1 Tax=Bombilactobacillus thymidiniphilus TaxID=2923363 RepID=A0ABY4PEV9_9LACO|nr:EsaB/YukD family protein [Bombilactobacillus thymidiniphilus]UQS84082.1 hypothetical protein MOO47_02710 [Bombilactobacillus thymidiniphilus]
MAKYINVTFKAITADKQSLMLDLRVPLVISVSQLIHSIDSGLQSEGKKLYPVAQQVIQVVTKSLIIADNDVLADFPITNGDILKLLN